MECNKEETQTFCEWICINSKFHAFYKYPIWKEGNCYFFHEDKPVDTEYFLPVIDSEGFPVTKTCRVDR